MFKRSSYCIRKKKCNNLMTRFLNPWKLKFQYQSGKCIYSPFLSVNFTTVYETIFY